MSSLGYRYFASAAVSFSSSGDHTVIAGVTGKTVKAYRILLVVDGATSITFKDGNGVSLTGAIPVAANGGLLLDLDSFGPEPWFVSALDDGLVIASSNAVQVSGKIDYLQS